VRIVRKQ